MSQVLVKHHYERSDIDERLKSFESLGLYGTVTITYEAGRAVLVESAFSEKPGSKRVVLTK